MKKVLFLLAMAVVSITASAQITWNAKAGVGIAHCYGDAEGLSSHIVGKIGVGIEKPLTSNWSLMPSFEVAIKGAQEDWDGEEKAKLNLYYLQIPILAAYRLNLSDSWNMTLKAGPYFAYAIAGNIKAGDYSEDIFKKTNDGYNGANRFDAGLDLGIEFEYQRWAFGAEYEFGLLSITKETNYEKDVDNEKYSIYNAAFYVTVGYKF